MPYVIRTALAVGIVGAACVMMTAEASAAQASVRGRIVNGTRQQPGSGDRVTLYRLQGGMEPIRELGAVTDTFEIDVLEVDEDLSYLVQVGFEGVHYNQLIGFSESLSADVQFTVYDVTTSWDDVEVSRARMTMVRQANELRAEMLYVVENRTDPPRTLYDPDGTFRFRLPAEMTELRAVSASSGSGMPVPQSTALDVEDTYSTRTAFKPGSTEISLLYGIDYANDDYTWREESIYDIPTLVVLISPSDVEVTVDASLEKLDAGPTSRFVVLRADDIAAGQTLEATLRGGTTQRTANPPPAAEGRPPHGTVQTIADAAAPGQGIVVTLMAAALGYGLLFSLYRGSNGKVVTPRASERQRVTRNRSTRTSESVTHAVAGSGSPPA